MFIMGHRGAAALEPENTLLSVKRAMEIGVDAVEIDVRFTRDKQLVVIHDATVNRTSNGKGEVSTFTLDQIQGLDAGKGEKIPTLQEVINLIGDRAGLIIELKEEGSEGPVTEIIQANNLFERTFVISFWHDTVRRVKMLDSRIRTGVLLVGCPVDTYLAEAACADTLVMNYAFVNREFVELAHKKDLKVIIWNIDNPAFIERYVDMGVDGIGSNDPRILVDYFGRGALKSGVS